MSELSEDEAVAALEDAQDCVEQGRTEFGWSHELMGRALLDRVRWLLAHEYVFDSDEDAPDFCPECYGQKEGRFHLPECSVALWARAAKRVGL